MKRRFGTVAAVLLMALLAGLWWRRGQDDRPAESAAATPASAASTPSLSAAPAAKLDAAPAPADEPRKLHGLRLISTEVAASRGWKPPLPNPEDSDPVRVARKRWHLTEVDFVSNGRTVPEVLAEIEQKYGLHVRIDPRISLEGQKLTMSVGGMSGDETMKFIAQVRKDVAFTIDAAGEAWMTTPEEAERLAAPPEPLNPDPNRATAGMIRWEIKLKRGPDGKWPSATIPPPSWKGRKVSVAIVRKNVDEALMELGEALGMKKPFRLAFFSKDATEKLADLQPVSLVATDMPVETAIDELLRGTGLVIEMDSGEYGRVRTAEEAEKRRQADDAITRQYKDEARETAEIRTRRVRIAGDVLTAADVALQVGSQLGVTARVATEVALCPALWESDGLEQSAGEVLDILARDGSLLWRWQGEVNGASDLHIGPGCLWVVGAVEK